MTTTVEMAATFRSQLPHLPRALGLVWRAAPFWTTAWSFLLVVQGLLPVAMVYLTRTVVDRLADSGKNGVTSESLRAVITPVIVLAVLFLASEILRAVTRLVRTAQADLVRDLVSERVHGQTVAADLAQFESPDFHDRLHRARLDSHEGPTESGSKPGFTRPVFDHFGRHGNCPCGLRMVGPAGPFREHAPSVGRGRALRLEPPPLDRSHHTGNAAIVVLRLAVVDPRNRSGDSAFRPRAVLFENVPEHPPPTEEGALRPHPVRGPGGDGGRGVRARRHRDRS